MRFFERPFVFLAALFMLGIVIGDFFAWNWWFSVPIIGLFAWSIFAKVTKKLNSPIFITLFILGFVTCGILSIQTSRNTYTVRQYEDSTATMIVQITELDGVRKQWKRAICEVQAIVDENKLRPHSETILCYINAAGLEVNDRLIIRSPVGKIENRNNPGEFDAQHYWNNKGIYSTTFVGYSDFKLIDKLPTPFYDQWRMKVKNLFLNVFESHLDGDELAIASALVLGDKSLLSQDVRKSFSAAGAMHVLAVSGLHIGIILEMLLFLFGRIPKLFSKNRAIIVSLVILWCYAMIIGFPPSVVRATLMFSVLSIGRMNSEQSDSLNILFFSAFLMLLFDPILLYDIGFQLSYLAMFGIFTIYKPIAVLFYIRNKWLRKLWEGTAIGIAAQLVTFPLTLYYFHQFPNYFLLTNIGMMVFAGIVLGLGIILLSLNWIGLFGKIIALVFGFSLAAMLVFVQSIEGMPGSLAEGFVFEPWLILACYLILLTLLFFRKNRKIVTISTISGIFLLIFIQFDRYSRITKSEIVIFNASQLVIAVKDQSATTFFFKAVPSKIEKVKFLGDAYLKTNASHGRFVELQKGITHFNFANKHISFEESWNGVLVTMKPSNKQFYIRTSQQAPYLEKMTNLSMNYLSTTTDAIALKEGAYIIAL